MPSQGLYVRKRFLDKISIIPLGLCCFLMWNVKIPSTTTKDSFFFWHAFHWTLVLSRLVFFVSVGVRAVNQILVWTKQPSQYSFKLLKFAVHKQNKKRKKEEGKWKVNHKESCFTEKGKAYGLVRECEWGTRETKVWFQHDFSSFLY